MLQPTQLQRLKEAVRRADEIFALLKRINDAPSEINGGNSVLTFDARGESTAYFPQIDLIKIIKMGIVVYSQQLHEELEALDKEFFSKTSEPEDDSTDEDLEEGADSETAELWNAWSNLNALLDEMQKNPVRREEYLHTVMTQVWPRLTEQLNSWFPR